MNLPAPPDSPDVAPAATTAADTVVRDVLSDGYARIRLGGDDRALLDDILGAAPEFFGRDIDAKMRHAGPDANFGFRPMGIEYAETAERPDVIESFTVWSDRTDLVPEHDLVGPLLGHVVRWQERLRAMTADVMAAFVDALGGRLDEPVAFARASHVQVNSTQVAPAGREFLQDRHEDGHLLTFIHADDDGLEIIVDDTERPVSFEPGELVVMPGSLLTLVSSQRVEPLFHQVRNLGIVGRLSVMYFVNPELERPVFEWTRAGEPTDLRSAIRDRPTEFGLPTVPTL